MRLARLEPAGYATTNSDRQRACLRDLVVPNDGACNTITQHPGPTAVARRIAQKD